MSDNSAFWRLEHEEWSIMLWSLFGSWQSQLGAYHSAVLVSIALTCTNVKTNCLKWSCKIKWDACEYCKMHVNAWELYNKCRNLYIIEWCIRVTLVLDSVFFSLFKNTLHLSLPGYAYCHHTLHISGGCSLFRYVAVFQLIFQWSNGCGSCKLDPF